MLEANQRLHELSELHDEKSVLVRVLSIKLRVPLNLKRMRPEVGRVKRKLFPDENSN